MKNGFTKTKTRQNLLMPGRTLGTRRGWIGVFVGVSGDAFCALRRARGGVASGGAQVRVRRVAWGRWVGVVVNVSCRTWGTYDGFRGSEKAWLALRTLRGRRGIGVRTPSSTWMAGCLRGGCVSAWAAVRACCRGVGVEIRLSWSAWGTGGAAGGGILASAAPSANCRCV